MKIRIDPPDKVTDYRHIHIYDENKNSLDINGNIGNKNDQNVYIRMKK